MIEEDKENSSDDARLVSDAGASEALLRAEISFWRDLLNSCDRYMPPESMERMQQALALAELRFLQLHGPDRAGPASCAGPIWTSSAGTRFLH